MSKRTGLIIIMAVILVIVVSFFVSKHAAAPPEQQTPVTTTYTEQNNGQDQVDNSVQPDINTEEFKLISSNVACAPGSTDSSIGQPCSGNIRVVPRAQANMEPGLYKINEQTKLLHDGTEQDLNSLQQLSQAETTVRLKLADGSIDTLREISY